MIKAVFFDIDGTLVSFKTHVVPKSTLHAIELLRKKGIKVFIATGRHRSSINNLGDLEFDGYVTLNGGYVFAGKDDVIYKHSIPDKDIEALVRYEGVKFVLISPEELKVPDYIRDDVLKASGHEFEEVERLEEALPKLDLLYMTRVQKERFFNEEDYVRMKDFYILDKKKMELAPQDMIVMHPLPRVNEIAVEVDDDPRAAYFKQAQYAVYARMALILTLLEVKVC